MKIRVAEDIRAISVDLSVGQSVVFGRQTDDEMTQKIPPMQTRESYSSANKRLIVAWAAEYFQFSRDHLIVKALEDGDVEITNQSQFDNVFIKDCKLKSKESIRLTPPFEICLPGRTLKFEGDSPEAASAHAMDFVSIPPNFDFSLADVVRNFPHTQVPDVDHGQEKLLQYLKKTLLVIQAAIGSSKFLERAAEALVEIVGLESGCVLLAADGADSFEFDKGKSVASYPTKNAQVDWRPSRSTLKTVCESQNLYWPSGKFDVEQEEAEANTDDSRRSKGLIVAAPILGWDSSPKVIGVLYGECKSGGSGPDPIRQLLINILANGVSAGLSRQRMAQEAELEAAKHELEVMRFDGFFGKKLAARLRDQQQSDIILGSKKTAITILFCDIRNYSTISANLDATTTYEWLGDVLTALSECVLEEEGVVVDYIGDEIMAMWGAPEGQEDQTDLALNAAFAMIRCLKRINEKWISDLGVETSIGVGIHFGDAQVGNCGTDKRIKYGALGDTVNRASRVQGLTKYLKCPILMTGEAVKNIKKGFNARKVVTTRLVGIDQPVELYEPASATEKKRDFFKQSWLALESLETAFDQFERTKQFQSEAFSKAATEAGGLLIHHSGDGPLLLTLSRATEALLRDGQGCSKVWNPPGK